MKSITIAGKLGRDAETRTVGNDSVTSFSVAVDSREKVNGQYEKRTTWFYVSLWGKRGEALAKHLTKGSAVCVSGDFSLHSYQTKDGTTKTAPRVKASEVTLLGGGNRDGQRTNAGGQRQGGEYEGGGDFGDEDIPF